MVTSIYQIQTQEPGLNDDSVLEVRTKVQPGILFSKTQAAGFKAGN
jgi:hypothetical protein